MSTDSKADYLGPEAEARAARIEAAALTGTETLADSVWLLRYATVKYNIRWPSHDEIMADRHDD